MFVYEILYRGNPDGTCAWHVILAREAQDITGKNGLELSPALPLSRAEELGFSFENILGQAAAASMKTSELLSSQLIDRTAERDEARSMCAELAERISK